MATIYLYIEVQNNIQSKRQPKISVYGLENLDSAKLKASCEFNRRFTI